MTIQDDKGDAPKNSDNPESHIYGPLQSDNFGYKGIPKSLIKPVFAAALRLRQEDPSVHDITRITKTSLDPSIVSAIIKAALRLLPPDKTRDGRKARLEEEKLTAEHAAEAEADFLEHLTAFGYCFDGEIQQKELMQAQIQARTRDHMGPTPDVVFADPVPICGQLCKWVEFKNYFGFRASPFVWSKNKKQFTKYAKNIGPGAVVYKLGFEQGLDNICGVICVREGEALKSLAEHAPQKGASGLAITAGLDVVASA